MFSYGFQPWAALTGHQILEAIDAPKFQVELRLLLNHLEMFGPISQKCLHDRNVIIVRELAVNL